MYYFRFDNSSQYVLFQNGSGDEQKCSYHAILDSLRDLNSLPELFDEMQIQLAERVCTGDRCKKAFYRYIESLRKMRQNDILWDILVDNLVDYANYHIPIANKKLGKLTHAYRLVIPQLFKQIQQMFRFLDIPAVDCKIENDCIGISVRCVSQAGQLYYCVDAPDLFLPAFIFLFLSAMQYAELVPCKCRVCGTSFCGKKSDLSCSKSECKKMVVLDTEQSRKEARKKILEKYHDKVRQDNYKLRQAGCPAAVIEEYKAIAKQQECVIRDKIAELEIMDATLFEILDAQELVKKNDYKPVTEEFQRIMREYCSV